MSSNKSNPVQPRFAFAANVLYRPEHTGAGKNRTAWQEGKLNISSQAVLLFQAGGGGRGAYVDGDRAKDSSLGGEGKADVVDCKTICQIGHDMGGSY